MALIKCKMCGGDLEITPGVTVAECEYCGTQQTLPKANDELVQSLFNRANSLRLKCEFDKAERIYEKILQQNDAEAEAHWGIVLCKYGIEYVEDPKTLRRIPTCHRTSYDAVIADPDFRAALAHADTLQRSIYEAEARKIDEIQKNILSIVKSEKPFDVFICYKETDENGRRSPDSAISNDIYHQLTQEGLKVFYAAITLEDKLGQAYEPYIFAALNSAKVMLVIGTMPHYFTSVWVKNEWSRFLKLMKTDRSKLLIPCYKDMDPYELPEEFAHLQAQDMAKIGFINDIVRGIRKVVGKETPVAVPVVPPVVRETVAAVPSVAPLLDRAFLFLEDGEWDSADEYLEKVLDSDPRNAHAYLGKLMAELEVQTQDALADCDTPFDDNANFQKAIRFGDDALKTTLNGYIDQINARNEEKRVFALYTAAVAVMRAAKSEADYRDAARKLSNLGDYRDCRELVSRCAENAVALKNNGILAAAKAKMTGSNISSYKDAIALLATIPGWQDADDLKESCVQTIGQLQEAAEAARQRRELEAEQRRKESQERKKRAKKATLVMLPVICILLVLILLVNCVITPMVGYNNAVNLMNAGQYGDAISAFQQLDGYKDSQQKIEDCNQFIENDRKYAEAVSLMQNGNYSDAKTHFEQLNGYKDSNQKVAECNAFIQENRYIEAISLMNAEKYAEAIAMFQALNGYKDSAEKLATCLDAMNSESRYNDAVSLMEAGKYAEAAEIFTALGSYRDSMEKLAFCQSKLDTKGQYEYAVSLMDQGKYAEAAAIFSELSGYENSAELLAQCQEAAKNEQQYQDAIALVAAGKKSEAAIAFGKLGNYRDARTKSFELWEDIAHRETFAGGEYHSVGLKSNGTVVAESVPNTNGYASNVGQCNVTGWKDIVAISAGYCHTVGLKADGTVVATGSNNYGQCNVTGWKDIVAISANDCHTIGLKADGTVVAVGRNQSGQRNVTGWKDIVAISAGTLHTIGLKADGTVVAVGSNIFGQRNVSGWKDIVSIGAGHAHSVGLKTDGTVVAVGYNDDGDDGQSNVNGWKDIVAISVGFATTIGLKADGTVVVAGAGHNSGITDLTEIVAITFNDSHTMVFKSDGTMVVPCLRSNCPCHVANWTDIKLPHS